MNTVLVADARHIPPPAEGRTPWAPWPYWGGKRTVAAEVWARFGSVMNLLEPFCGSAAILLARPQPFGGVESIGDLDGHLVNVWRALKHAPKKVAVYVMDPPNSFDMAARRAALRLEPDELPRLLATDPEYFDARLAGFWLYCQSCWLTGVSSTQTREPTPRLWRNGMGVCRYRNDVLLLADLQALSRRLRYVRICHGDWKRLTTEAALRGHGMTAIFLDPPYGVKDRYKLYTKDSRDVSHEVYQWARENEDDPNLRIALAGYDGEHIFPESWSVFTWESHGFVGKMGSRGRENRKRERIWFSPGCLKPKTTTDTQLTLGLLKEDY